jgi:hypothetical protein
MSETVKETSVDKYEYFRSLSLDEISTHLAGLTQDFHGVQRHYTGLIGRRRSKIKKEDSAALTAVVVDLLPMSTNPEVNQQALSDEDVKPEDLVISQITGMTQEVLVFMARFENTGITAFQLPQHTAS